MSKNIVLGVTGSIAAYKAAELIRLFKRNGFNVKTILTKSGAEFITPLTLETLSKNPVVTDMFSRNTPYDVEHVSLAKWADVFLIAPATANFLGKYANGIADDFLTTTVMATAAPVVIAPAMNTAMYEHPANQANMNLLKNRGVLFVEPDTGELACGDNGKGRMSQPEDIFDYVVRIISKKEDLSGKVVMVTAGATIEDIDPVRYITNRSTGKMGIAIANAAAQRGAKVYLVFGGKSNAIHPDVDLIPVRSTEDMLNAVRSHIDESDMFISAAAPADFTPVSYSPIKIKKNGEDGLTIDLKPTPDILKSLVSTKGNRIHIGFAAETDSLEENALRKLEKKSLDAIALNDVSAPGCGFSTDTNAVTWFTRSGLKIQSGLMPKTELAHWLLDRVLELIIC